MFDNKKFNTEAYQTAHLSQKFSDLMQINLKLIFSDCYKNLAFCNINCIKQFIILKILVLICYASLGIKNESETKQCDVHLK